MTSSSSLPSTTIFPSDPSELERPELEETYLALRGNYRGAMIARGRFRGQAHRGREAMVELENKLRAIAEREASVRAEAYEMLEIVTNVVGELEDAGDDLVNEFGLYQKGRTTYQGGGFLGRLIKAIARFISRWTGTKQQLQKILDRQASIQNTLEGSDGQAR